MARGDPLEAIKLVVSQISMWIPDHFVMFFAIAEYGIFGHLLEILLRYFGEITDTDTIMHPRHFGTDPTDIRNVTGLIRQSGWNPG